ncbi:hypothetical protein D9J77_23405 [Escherichia coli]|nr:hypothetical protein [Escherichia coli]
MKYSSIFSMLSFFILFACNETAVYGSDENIIFMRYVEKLHLDKYSVKNTVKTETMAIQLAEIYGNDSNLLIVFYVQIMPDDFVMQLHRF